MIVVTLVITEHVTHHITLDATDLAEYAEREHLDLTKPDEVKAHFMNEAKADQSFIVAVIGDTTLASVDERAIEDVWVT